jgi:hypothetical protein
VIRLSLRIASRHAVFPLFSAVQDFPQPSFADYLQEQSAAHAVRPGPQLRPTVLPACAVLQFASVAILKILWA